MSGYIPQVGDRVRHKTWTDAVPTLTITAVGEKRWLAKDDFGHESMYSFDSHWLKVPDPLVFPERWMNVYGGDVMFVAHTSRRSADIEASTGRIAVIHLAADGTLTLHPVERES
jgi:hypothetical protein